MSAANTLYRQLKANERLKAMLLAAGRGDEVEFRRLATSCPRADYRIADPAFTTRLEAVYHVVMMFCQEVDPLLVQGLMARQFETGLRGFAKEASAQLEHAFELGVRVGLVRGGQRDGQREHLAGSACGQATALTCGIEQADQFASASRTREHLERIVLSMADGFDRFCRCRIELSRMEVLEAVAPATAARLATVLAEAGETEVEEQVAVAVFTRCEAAWVRRTQMHRLNPEDSSPPGLRIGPALRG